jgi:hypothetical protein
MKSIHTRHRGTVAAANTVRLRTFYIADAVSIQFFIMFYILGGGETENDVI